MRFHSKEKAGSNKVRLHTQAPYINGGDVSNKGVELSLAWNDRVGKDFTYGLSLNASYNKNEVTRIANSEGIIHGNEGAIASVNAAEFYRAQVGYPIGYFWGYKTDGVMQNQEKGLRIRPQYGAFPDRNYDSPKVWGDPGRINDILRDAEEKQ